MLHSMSISQQEKTSVPFASWGDLQQRADVDGAVSVVWLVLLLDS